MKCVCILRLLVAAGAALSLAACTAGRPESESGASTGTDPGGDRDGPITAAPQALASACPMTSDLCADDGLGGDHFTLWHCVKGAAPVSPIDCPYGCITLPGTDDKCGHPYIANAEVMALAFGGHFDGSGRLLWDDGANGALGGNRLPSSMGALSTSFWVDSSISGIGSTASVACGGGAPGDWCGSESNVVGGEKDVLYHCTRNEPATNARICTTKCVQHPRKNDTCEGATETITLSSFECAGFAQIASGAPRTSKWVRGERAVDNCPPAGTIVATFNSAGHYAGHAGIVVTCSSTTLELFDSNWIDTTKSHQRRHVGRHTLTTAGTTELSNAGNYHIVLAP